MLNPDKQTDGLVDEPCEMRRAESITARFMPKKKYRIAVVDDYQIAALESADWSLLPLAAAAATEWFREHLLNPGLNHS